MKYVIKASGDREKFEKRKIKRTARKAGASKKLANEIANKIDKSFSKEISAKVILNRVLGLLKDKPKIASIYDLKRAIMSMGPAGFFFEEFISQVLRVYGYDTDTNQVFKGKVVNQEVDVLAKKDFVWMIECKYHNHVGNSTHSKATMYTYARFLDIKSNKKNKIDRPWLITNTKCTKSAVGYAKGVDLKLTSWNHPKKESLQKLIGDKKLYPVTILKISKNTKHKLFSGKIVLVRDIVRYDLQQLSQRTKLSHKKIRKLKGKASKILG